MTQTAKKGGRAALLAATAAALLCGLFLLMQQAVREGVRQGLVLCAGTLVPALFPFMVFSDVLAATGKSEKTGWGGRMFGRIFALPERCVWIFLLGALCGIPLGARETARAWRAGELDRESAERLVLMSNLCGPAFLIAGVGAGLRHSVWEGVWLYGIQLAAALISGWLFSLPRRKKGRQIPLAVSESTPHITRAGRPHTDPHAFSSASSSASPSVSPSSLFSASHARRASSPASSSATAVSPFSSDSPSLSSPAPSSASPSTPANASDTSLRSLLPRAITRAAGDMLGVCGSVCLFSAVSALFSACLPSAVAAVLSALTELTGGVGDLHAAFLSSPSLSFALTSGAVGFGGMSIHMQAFVFLDGTDLRAGRYLSGKALAGAIALVFGAIVGRFL